MNRELAESGDVMEGISVARMSDNFNACSSGAASWNMLSTPTLLEMLED